MGQQDQSVGYPPTQFLRGWSPITSPAHPALEGSSEEPWWIWIVKDGGGLQLSSLSRRLPFLQRFFFPVLLIFHFFFFLTSSLHLFTPPHDVSFSGARSGPVGEPAAHPPHGAVPAVGRRGAAHGGEAARVNEHLGQRLTQPRQAALLHQAEHLQRPQCRKLLQLPTRTQSRATST